MEHPVMKISAKKTHPAFFMRLSDPSHPLDDSGADMPEAGSIGSHPSIPGGRGFQVCTLLRKYVKALRTLASFLPVGKCRLD